MKITHYTNSFIRIEEGEESFVCDPWIGFAEHIGWVSHPISQGGIEILREVNPHFLYISHLHTDHLDKPLLAEYQNKGVLCCIKKFSDGRLRRQLEQLGFKNILECEAWKPYTVGNFEIAIVPADQSNTDGLMDSVVYDLDTSILIRSNASKEIFYNNVDSPMSVESFRQLRKFVDEKYGKGNINFVCMAVGAAGEYPQCFLNIDRVSEKKRIVDGALVSLEEKLRILRPDVFFPAGGTYVIYGKYHPLNEFIAQPDPEQLGNFVREKLGIHSCLIEGGKTLFQSPEGYVTEQRYRGERSEIRVDTIQKTKDVRYPYFENSVGPRDLDELFSRAEEKFLAALQRFKIPMNFVVEFLLYDDLCLSEKGELARDSQPVKSYQMRPLEPAAAIQTLRCHMDMALFGKLLKGEYVWNEPLGGSFIFYERTPNVFYPTLVGALNFLRV